LQVEHPVTEMITGIDLVREQLHVAAGNKLSFSQEDLKIHGHAVEVRVYAEDPANNFLPSVGKLSTYITPRGVGVRVDDGYEQGMEIPIYYDPMIAKLITYGRDRDEAIARMIRAIDEYKITGCETTLPFCRFVMQHNAFVTAKFDTHFVKKYFTPEVLEKTIADEAEIASLAAQLWLEEKKPAAIQQQQEKTISYWRNNRS
ncbi:MAG TPA: biotin carboxylase, partial [Bacteroidia bacterium]|nr:biotin carboxylase [Bacteroidia bacterium]